MTRRRRRLFGPLLYFTLILAVIATAYTGIVTVGGDLTRTAMERRQMKDIASMFRDTNSVMRESGAKILLTKGVEVSVPYLLEAAHDPRSEIRALACRSLVQAYADPRVAVPVLNAATGDAQEEVRLEAARGLGRVRAYAAVVGRSNWAGGDPTAHSQVNSVETLSHLLKDPASSVRAASAESLGEFAPDLAAATGLEVAIGDQDRAVRLAAAKALLKFGDNGKPLTIRTLLVLLADPEPVPDRYEALEVLKGISDEAQEQAAAALARLLSRRALGHVRRVAPEQPEGVFPSPVSDESAVCPDVIDCLHSLGPRAHPALPALESLLNDDDHVLRHSAGLAVVAILGKNHPRSVAILVGIISDETLPRDWRTSSLLELQAMGPAALAKTTPALIRQLGDPNPTVRVTALSLLQEIVGMTPAEMPKPGEGK